MKYLKKLHLILMIIISNGLTTIAMELPLTDEVVLAEATIIAKQGLFKMIEAAQDYEDINKIKLQLDFIKNVLKIAPNFVNDDDETPLIIAIQMNSEIGDRIAELLIQAGADVNKIEPQNGNAPLHIAIAIGNVYLTQVLVDAGARVVTKNLNGFMPEDMVNIAIKKLENTNQPHTARRQELMNIYIELKNILRLKKMRR